ncbi:MAG: hypothetical protein ACP5OP_04825 [Leptospirillia bacterium]
MLSLAFAHTACRPFRSRRLFPYIFAALILGALLWAPPSSHAAPPKVRLSTVSASSAPRLLTVSISPAPTSAHPLHLHIYLDGRMILMRSFTSSPATLRLPPLSPGRHEITVREADALTHREMSDKDSMEGMDMDGMDMSGMKRDEDAKDQANAKDSTAPHPLARLVIVEGKN